MSAVDAGGFPAIGMSQELAQHHVRSHARERGCAGGVRFARRCPCHLAYMLTCVTCGEAVLLLVRDDAPVCDHAREAWTELGVSA